MIVKYLDPQGTLRDLYRKIYSTEVLLEDNTGKMLRTEHLVLVRRARGFRVWAGLVGKSAWYQQKYKLFLGCWLDPLKYSWWARSHMNSARDTCPVTISESSFDVYFPVHCDLKLDQMLYHKLHTPCLHNPRNFQMALGVGRLPTCNPSWTAPVQLCL